MFDLKNVPNSVHWSQIKGELAKVGVPGYMASLAENYPLDYTLYDGGSDSGEVLAERARLTVTDVKTDTTNNYASS